MNKPIILGIGGAVVGVVVAFAAFTFLMGGSGTTVVAAPPTEPVNVGGKLGPHVTLSDRVFNLLPEAGSDKTYLKLQTVIEFETYDERWQYVLNGCGHGDDHGALFGVGGDLMVSAVPAGAPVRPLDGAAAAGPEVDPCDAEYQALMSEFDHELGTGLQLIEDAVTTVVTGHTAAEIATTEGKEALKEEIKVAIDELIHEPKVHRVLFLNFITQ
ncbi:MAG: flagellar basal body-associated FliL family protein [Dehalococcoidia bacterium]